MEKSIFAKIIDREIPADIVYEDENTLAFLDISPATKGHVLVIPKNISTNIYDISDTDLANVIKIAKKVAIAQKKSLNAVGVNISMNNEAIAGQIVFHPHIHVIPRYIEGDYVPGNHLQLSKEEMEEIREKIAKELN